jgi:uncharacterized protein YcbK (DUF882 family)
MDRRSFLLLGAKAVGGMLAVQTAPVWAASTIPSCNLGKEVRSLAFYHTHTCECLDITYARNGIYDQKAMRQISAYLRDFRTSEMHPIDPQVLDILWKIQQELGCSNTYEVISGYRSPKTNRLLRRRSRGVADRSLHMQGKAIDIRLTGRRTHTLRDCAIALEAGGVGYYAESDFVHIDTGRVRTW